MGVVQDIFKSGAEGIISGLTNGTANIISKIKADPTKVLEYEKEIEVLHVNAGVELEKLGVQLESEFTKQQDIVNQTMREEAKSEHFLQWSWRPLIGYTLIAMCVNNYILLPYLKYYGLQPIELPTEIISTIMVILGVASAGRSSRQAGWFNKKK